LKSSLLNALIDARVGCPALSVSVPMSVTAVFGGAESRNANARGRALAARYVVSSEPVSQEQRHGRLAKEHLPPRRRWHTAPVVPIGHSGAMRFQE
jgi:hypothetical protein